MTSIRGWIRARPVVAFYLITFAITWLSWFPMTAYNRGWVGVDVPLLFFLGGLGPGIAAYVVMRVLRGRRADRELLGPLLRWRVGAGWYVVAVGLFVVIWLAAVAVSGDLAQEVRSLTSLSLIALALGRYLLAAVPEEVGWRGFALPMLQARFSALTSSLIVGVLWALWHLPLLLGGNPAMSGYPLIPYVIWVTSESVLYGWLYNNTRGSLLIAVLAHGVANVVGVFSSAPIATTVITAMLATLVVLVYGPRHLTRAGFRVTLANGDRAGNASAREPR